MERIVKRFGECCLLRGGVCAHLNQIVVSFAQQTVREQLRLVDEIATRVLATGGRVIGVRKTDIPREQSIAAVLRYAA